MAEEFKTCTIKIAPSSSGKDTVVMATIGGNEGYYACLDILPDNPYGRAVIACHVIQVIDELYTSKS
ncbi:hypothetical protein LCGC14_1017700 [marine sediment metagenome]|uniref:Uncharacterized protein n=1 Tax=marine sediment metagenome TaxID=412755 RepID=A0A0F9R4G7_9ZZZZ